MVIAGEFLASYLSLASSSSHVNHCKLQGGCTLRFDQHQGEP